MPAQAARLEERRFVRTALIASVGERIGRVALFLTLSSGAVLFLLPLYIMLTISLKSRVEAANTSPWAWPIHPTFDNYRQVWSDPNINFLRAAANTLVLSVVPTIGTVLSASLVAFPFARLRFRGRDRLFVVLLATMMLPGIVTLIPGYVLMAKLGWIDTFKPWIVGSFLGGGAFNIFLIRQFMLSIPREMDEAAKIDGASNAVIFWRVLLPNCSPVLATIAVFSFVGGYRDFLGPLMMLNSPEMQPLEVALKSLQGSHSTEFNLLMAGSMITTVPLIVLFIFCQRYFIKGITLTGGK
jgi:ABC-type glycerol-3-phosphate transport system permease component